MVSKHARDGTIFALILKVVNVLKSWCNLILGRRTGMSLIACAANGDQEFEYSQTVSFASLLQPKKRLQLSKIRSVPKGYLTYCCSLPVYRLKAS